MEIGVGIEVFLGVGRIEGVLGVGIEGVLGVGMEGLVGVGIEGNDRVLLFGIGVAYRGFWNLVLEWRGC
jgi:hypothetical protein